MTTPATNSGSTGTTQPPATGAVATPPAKAEGTTTVETKTTDSSAKTEGSKATQEGTPKSTEKPGAEADAKTSPDDTADLSISLPDGVTADQAFLDGFRATAKELGLKSEQAQKFADLYVNALKQSQELEAKALADNRAKWVESIKSSPEFAGEKFALAKTAAEKAALKFGGAELAELLKGPLGDHPGIFRGWAAVAAADAEDRMGADSARPKPTDTEAARLARMFPKMTNKE